MFVALELTLGVKLSSIALEVLLAVLGATVARIALEDFRALCLELLDELLGVHVGGKVDGDGHGWMRAKQLDESRGCKKVRGDPSNSLQTKTG